MHGPSTSHAAMDMPAANVYGTPCRWHAQPGPTPSSTGQARQLVSSATVARRMHVGTGLRTALVSSTSSLTDCLPHGRDRRRAQAARGGAVGRASGPTADRRSRPSRRAGLVGLSSLPRALKLLAGDGRCRRAPPSANRSSPGLSVEDSQVFCSKVHFTYERRCRLTPDLHGRTQGGRGRAAVKVPSQSDPPLARNVYLGAKTGLQCTKGSTL